MRANTQDNKENKLKSANYFSYLINEYDIVCKQEIVSIILDLNKNNTLSESENKSLILENKSKCLSN